jgi:hypothetical protein
MKSIEELTEELLSLPSAARALLADKLVEDALAQVRQLLE